MLVFNKLYRLSCDHVQKSKCPNQSVLSYINMQFIKFLVFNHESIFSHTLLLTHIHRAILSFRTAESKHGSDFQFLTYLYILEMLHQIHNMYTLNALLTPFYLVLKEERNLPVCKIKNSIKL